MATDVSLVLSYYKEPETVSLGAKRPGRDADRSSSLVRMLIIHGCVLQTVLLWGETDLTGWAEYWWLCVCHVPCVMCHRVIG